MTVPSEDSKTLLAKVAGVEKWLIEQGAIPARPEVAPIAPMPMAQASAAQPEHGPERCSIHQVAMTKNERNAQTWYSHRVDEGWCKGKRNGNGK